MFSRDIRTVARRAAFCFALGFVSSAACLGCGSSAAKPDAGRLDGGVDFGVVDLGPVDLGRVDLGRVDLGPFDAGPRPTAPLAGELNFLGIVPTLDTIHVRARRIPAPFVGSRTVATPAPPPAVILPAVVSATADPRVFTFQIPDLVEADLYQIGVDVDDPAAGALDWRGPRAGLLTPGGPAARFDAVAVRSHLEVRGTRADGEHWVSRDFVRTDAMSRRFRWSTALAGVSGFDLQFATERFDVDQLSPELACAPPQGLLHTQRVVNSVATVNEADVDLATVLAAPPAGADALVRARWEQIRYHHAPLYVRAVPVQTDTKLCDPLLYGIGSWVELVVVVPEETPIMIGGPPTRLTGTYDHGSGPWVEPMLGAVCYTVVTPKTLPVLGVDPIFSHDPLAWNIVATGYHPGGYTMLPGESFCHWPPTGGDSSFFDDLVSGFSDAVTGFIDAVAQAVNTIAALYEAIKGIAVDLVAYALDGIVGCPAWCHSLVQMAAEYALVAMGLPPTLPNFDQLVDKGINYLAEEIAAQTGVPSDVYLAAVDIATDMVEREKATRGGSSGSFSWVVEDTGFRPSTLILDVSRGSALGTPTRGLYVTGSGAWLPVSANLYTPAPGEPAIRMPLVLSPDFTGIASPPPIFPELPGLLIPAYYGHAERVQAYYQQPWFNTLVSNSCVAIRADAVEFGFLGIPTFVQPYADVTLFNTPGGFTDPFVNSCTP